MFVCIILLISTFFASGSTKTEELFNYNRTVLEWVFLTNIHNTGWNVSWEDSFMINHCDRYYQANKPFLQIDENENVYPAPGFEPSCNFLLIDREIAKPIVFLRYPQLSPQKVDILRCKCAWKNTVNETLVNPDDGYFYLSELELMSAGVTDEETEYYENHFIYFEMEPTTDYMQFYAIKKCWAINADD